MSEWIKCSDRLPKINNTIDGPMSDRVMVLTEGNQEVETYHDYSDFDDDGLSWFADGFRVTHWRPLTPLPEPPKE